MSQLLGGTLYRLRHDWRLLGTATGWRLSKRASIMQRC